MNGEVKEIKARIRKKIWELLERSNIAMFPRPVHGRIPNFKGADIASSKLTLLREWNDAHVVKSNPDSPQYYIRLRALEEGKLILMATPRLLNGFILLDPRRIQPSKYATAATIKGAFKYGYPMKLRDLPKVDLIVTGCVAVDRRGVRLGKGGGFSELEYAILKEIDSVDDYTPILTTIHDLQLIDENIPLEIHDFTVDYVLTPTKIVKIPESFKYRPRGIYPDLLTQRIRELDIIRELFEIK
ncbi:MAG: 5-formyltetrahydrofolate cyclo-ligase [Desulfurococcaceae archaeon]